MLDYDNLLEYSIIKQVVSKKRGSNSCYILFSREVMSASSAVYLPRDPSLA